MNMKSAVLRKVIAVSMAAAMVTGTALCAPVISDFAGTSITVSAAETYGDFEYTVADDNTVTVTKYKGTSAKVTVPEKINSKTVTAIGDSAFNKNTGITGVTLPKTLKTIKKYAFAGCSNLASINIPGTVETIGEYAFSNCSKMTSFSYPVNLKSAGSYIFYNTPVKTVTIPETVTAIPSYTFNHANMLEKVVLPDTITKIGEYAFYDCPKLTSINLPDTVETIERSALAKCGLTSINFPKRIKTVGFYVFENTPIKSIKVKEGVTALPNSAFHGANKLESVVLPTTLKTIGEYSFYNCTSLKAVTIPEETESIGRSAFYNCTALTKVVMNDSLKTIGNSAFEDCEVLASIEIPDTVTTIGSYAFQNCKKLTTFNYPKRLTSIGSNVLENVPVKTITVKSSVTALPENAFSGANLLEKVVLPSGLTKIGAKAFYDCSSLTSVNIPDGVTSIGSSAFGNCGKLTSVNFPKSLTSTGYYIFENAGIKTITVKEGVTALPNGAFYNANKLEKVVLPSTLTKIGSSVFENCSSLTSVNVPDSVTSIGNYAFEGCKKLTSINYPKNLTSMGYGVFTDVPITCVTVKEGVTVLPNHAFHNANKIEKISLPSTIQTLGQSAFEGCSSLAILKVGTKIEKIGSYAFDSCKKLTIYGKADTYMSTYAANKNIPYVTEFSNLTMVTPKDKVSDTQNFVIMADASGGKTPYTYAVYYKLASDDKWTTLQGFGSTAKATFNPPYMGDYQLCVKVKDAGGAVQAKYFDLGAERLLKNKSTLSDKEILFGESFTVNAKATGGYGGYKYAILYKKAADSEWTTKQDYSTNTKLTIKPAGTGTYNVCVKVKDADGDIVKTTLDIKVNKPLANTSTISATEINLGDTVTVNAKGTGGIGAYTYAVLYKKTSESKWTNKQDFAANAKVSFKPTTATSYDVCVKVKDSKGTVEKKYFTVKVTAAALTNTSTISAESIKLGETVTLNGSAKGGKSPYTYSFLYKKTSESKWTNKQDFAANATVSVKPSAATTYDICIKVKDAKGTVEKKYFTVKVTKPLANTSTISATAIKKGGTVTVTGSATGGAGSYTYSVLYKQKSQSKWTTKQDFAANAKVSVQPSAATTYDVCVKVKDKDGTVEKKYFEVKVS